MKRRLAAIGITLVAGVAFAPPVHSLPPGGASPNTPGTSSALSPTSVEACGTMTWEVWGFAPNEIVNVKINDGALSGGDMSVQGQGVVSQARADSTGYAVNSVDIPCGLEPGGNYWLRFLATEVLNDAGETRGYTHQSQYFEVLPAANSGGGAGGGTHNGGGAAQNPSGNRRSGGGQNSPGTVSGTDHSGGNPSNTGGGVIGGGGGNNTGSNTANNAGSTDSGGGTGNRRTVRRQQVAGSNQSNQAGQPAGGGGDSGGSGSAGSGAGSPGGGGASSSNSGGDQLQTSSDILAAQGGGNGNYGGTGGGDSSAGLGLFNPDNSDTYASSASGSSPRAPIVGLTVGGSILLVGLTGVIAYVYVNRPRRSSVSGEEGTEF
ncbi:Uncharacterised protein [Corynebacterium cystitidis]|uniref:Uncharacterized protein n=2 Tax=Corynebacterium cystitidis TaxID=35757 RepID=A0A1H9UPL1_9CORY|nr:hypothetical protein SAMN05661109_01909 [Corynebacterium cystitidis DSM 20524]SNV90273.1 Uncharacterised protein [Corynebacterium cystitidis]